MTGSNPMDTWHRLDCFRKSYTSQHGEDGIVEYLLSILPATPKICLEVGAYDGLSMSNTHRLWASMGWQALLIEASPVLYRELEKRVSGYPNVVSVQEFISAIGANSLPNLLKRNGISTHIGVLSLDIDANELEVLENLDDLVADIMIVEFNHDIPSDVVYRDIPGDVFFRHSAKATELVAMKMGYRIVACTGPNAILVRESAITPEAATKLPNVPVEALFDYAFLRRKHSSRAVVRSKLVSEELAFLGEPNARQRLALRAMSLLRKARLRLRRGIGRQASTSERRKNLARQGFWI